MTPRLAPQDEGSPKLIGQDFLVLGPRELDSHTITGLADRFSRFGYRFVPLVTRDLDIACAIEVLFLRPDPPGKLVLPGDIDNRLKTLFDALTMPRDKLQVGPHTTCEEGEDPFFCLLEDDSLITKASVETGTLLQITNEDANQTVVVIT